MKNLAKRKEEIWSIGQQLFHELVNLPQEVRFDKTTRTGVHIVVKDISNNIGLVSIEDPTDIDVFHSIENIVCMREKGFFSSQNFGCLGSLGFGFSTKNNQEFLLEVSSSGLKGHENVLISLIVLSYLTDTPSMDVIERIKKEGGLFPSVFEKKGSYVYNVIERYNTY